MKQSSLLCVILSMFAGSCGGSDSSPAPGDLTEQPPEPALPSAPAENDPAFTVSQLRKWYLIGNAITEGHDALSVEVAPPEGVKSIDLWIDGRHAGALAAQGGAFALTADIAALAPGEHEVLLSADGAATAFSRLTFQRSHPFYVVVTNDWDDADNADETLRRQEELHERHPELKLTHFVGPYTFTDPAVTPERRQALADWVKGMRDTYGDEIGLHIHPYCNFVETTSVPCRTEPSFAYANGDPTGYTVILSSYTEEEFAELLDAADALFVENGLGKPTSFRAGGWSAGANTLRALAKSGYVADTSAVNWKLLEEWEDHPGADLYPWNKENWSTIDDTSQPYYPNEQDVLSSQAPTIPILEVPDNGALVDYVRSAEMISIFQENWPGGALDAPRQLSIGYHPPNFSEDFKRRMDETFTYVEQFLISADGGPVVYATLSSLTQVWPNPAQ